VCLGYRIRKNAMYVINKIFPAIFYSTVLSVTRTQGCDTQYFFQKIAGAQNSFGTTFLYEFRLLVPRIVSAPYHIQYYNIR
jgi:hypothetical protein